LPLRWVPVRLTQTGEGGRESPKRAPGRGHALGLSLLLADGDSDRPSRWRLAAWGQLVGKTVASGLRWCLAGLGGVGCPSLDGSRGIGLAGGKRSPSLLAYFFFFLFFFFFALLGGWAAFLRARFAFRLFVLSFFFFADGTHSWLEEEISRSAAISHASAVCLSGRGRGGVPRLKRHRAGRAVKRRGRRCTAMLSGGADRSRALRRPVAKAALVSAWQVPGRE